MGKTSVHRPTLDRELSAHPAWLADMYRAWIQQEEAMGNEFTCARAAILHAIDACKVGS